MCHTPSTPGDEAPSSRPDAPASTERVRSEDGESAGGATPATGEASTTDPDRTAPPDDYEAL